jgi:hypothetical protein
VTCENSCTLGNRDYRRRDIHYLLFDRPDRPHSSAGLDNQPRGPATDIVDSLGRIYLERLNDEAGFQVSVEAEVEFSFRHDLIRESIDRNHLDGFQAAYPSRCFERFLCFR